MIHKYSMVEQTHGCGHNNAGRMQVNTKTRHSVIRNINYCRIALKKNIDFKIL